MHIMNLIDSHCHLDFDEFANDRDAVIENALDHGVRQFIIPSVKAGTWPQLINLCETYSCCHYALGLHPCFIEHHSENNLTELLKLAATSKPVAIGEIGLDYFEKSADKEKQWHFLRSQLKIAGKLQLPVIIHARKSIDDVISILDETGFANGGIMHAFNGSLQQAEKLMAKQFCFGFGGMLTYARSSKLRHLAKSLPLQSIVLETDAPDMTGAAHQHQRNSPEYLPEVLKTLAAIKKLPASLVAEQTTSNVKSLFKLES